MIIEYHNMKIRTGYLVNLAQKTWTLEEAKAHTNWVEKTSIPIVVSNTFRSIQDAVRIGSASITVPKNELFCNNIEDARLMLRRLGPAEVKTWDGCQPSHKVVDINAYEENIVR